MGRLHIQNFFIQLSIQLFLILDMFCFVNKISKWLQEVIVTTTIHTGLQTGELTKNTRKENMTRKKKQFYHVWCEAF